MDLKEMGWVRVDWIHLAKDGDQCLSLIKTIMNL